MELLGVTEIGMLLGVSKQRADQLTRTQGFPKPVSELASGRIWRKSDVTKWIASSSREANELQQFDAETMG
jgi:predicted DNA-binding transcriptional regulator AlpA